MTDPGTVRVHADVDACVGAGNCFVTAPAVFDLDDEEGTVKVLTEQVPPEHEAAARAAADGCPAAALLVEP
jgi:ferredoxin